MILTAARLGHRRRLLRRLGWRSACYYYRRASRGVERVLPVGPQPAVVARRHVDGGDHLRRRHAAGGRRPRGARRHRRQLDLVERRDRQHADGVLLRAALAARRHPDRRRVRRAALRRPPRRAPARLSRALSRAPDQLRDHGLGQPGDGEGPVGDAGVGSADGGARQPGDHRHLLSAVSGLWGVVVTDFFQFMLAMARHHRARLVRAAAAGRSAASTACARSCPRRRSASCPRSAATAATRRWRWRCRWRASSPTSACSGGRAGIRGRSPAAAATSRSA